MVLRGLIEEGKDAVGRGLGGMKWCEESVWDR